MPFFKFFIHGRLGPAFDGARGFYTARAAFAATEAAAWDKVLKALDREYGPMWRDAPPELTIEETERIGLAQFLRLANRGSAFYEEDEEDEAAT